MTKNNKKYGFSLAESIISMMILALVIMLTLSVITRKKTTPTNKTTISGMYACWNDGTNHQQTYDGHALKSSNNPSACTFEMDRRAYKYYVYAVGKRATGVNNRGKEIKIDGQVVQEIIPTPTGENEDEMELKIELGGSKNGGTTTIKQNGNIVVQALGGIRWTKSGLVDGNIKTCKMVDNTSPCESSNQLPKCEIQNSKSQAYQNDGINPYKTSIVVNCIKDRLTLDTKQYLLEDLIKINSSIYKRGSLKFSIQEIDSSLKATEKPKTKNSLFVRYLKMIPQNIQNGLTDTLLKYYQKDNEDKNGVVLIIW